MRSEGKNKLLKILEARFRTYLAYDQISDERFNDPWDKERSKRLDIDAKRLAEIAINEIK